MRAMRIHKFGGPEVLQADEVEKPLAEAGELLVQVMAASLNPVDLKIRAGGYNRSGEQALPLTLGRDLAGVVEQVGLDVAGFHIGDDVFALLGPDRGADAEYVIVRAEEAAPKPENLDYIEAAAVPLAGLTAWQGLFDHGGLEPGQRVLIHGGAGGVGHLAVQFAKARGAFVATTAAAADRDFLIGLGADQVIDYENRRFEDEARDIDLVFDLIGGDTQDRSWAVLKPGGIIVSTLKQPSAEEAKRRGLRGATYMTHPDAGRLVEIARSIEAGRVKPRIHSTYPLERVAEAHAELAQGHVAGKIVLKLAP